LERIEGVLVKIDARVTVLEQQGSDVERVRELIKDAQTALVEAQDALALQAGHDYTVTLTEEMRVRADVRESHDALKGDLVALRDLVRGAHGATRAAALELAAHGISTEMSASSSTH
jgi:hypothetical protein